MKTFFAGALAAATALTSLPATVASAGDGFTWTYTRDVRANVFETFLRVSYAIPETDDRVVTMDCAIGNRAPYIVLQLSAFIDGGRNGDSVSVQFTDGSGRRFDATGTVVGMNAEFGISGVELTVETGDRFLDIFTERGDISYRVQGGGLTTLPMGGIGDQVQFFRNDCAQIGDLKPAGGGNGGGGFGGFGGNNGGNGGNAPTPALDPKTQASIAMCDRTQSLQSRNNGAALQVEFRNETDSSRALIWRDANGGFVDMGFLDQGQSLFFNSAVGHVWEVVDAPGNCLQAFELTSADGVVRIKAPNRYFGDE